MATVSGSVSARLACMQDEIFGALKNIKTYDDLDEVIDFINAREHPLALYYFGVDTMERDRFIAQTCSGGVYVNNVTMHVANDALAFGGIGTSGTGNYCGRDGFRTFSHARSVYREGWVAIAKLAGTLTP
jgi:coniferyl-aldehyde dehydrogenase